MIEGLRTIDEPLGVQALRRELVVIYGHRRPCRTYPFPRDYEVAKVWWRMGNVIYRLKKAWPAKIYDANKERFFEGFCA